MGASSSVSLSELVENNLLQQLSGQKSISPNDPFWNQLLSFSFNPPKSSTDHRLLEESSEVLCRHLGQNNIKTGNFTSLVRVFLSRCSELKVSTESADNVFTWQTYNALFIIRCVCKYFVENMSEESLLKQFNSQTKEPDAASPIEAIGEENETSCALEDFISALVTILVDVPVVSFNYIMHVEAINCLLVLLSVQIFVQKSSVNSTVYKYIMQGKASIHSCLLMKTLVNHFIEQPPSPPYLMGAKPVGGSLVIGLASGIWNMLRGSPAKEEGSGGGDTVGDQSALGQQSILLALVLVTHWTHDKGVHNPYRLAFYNFTDQESGGSAAASSPTQSVATFKVPFSGLYTTLCSSLENKETSTLALYFLVHQNIRVRDFLLSRTNIEQLIVPIMKVLYTAQRRNSHHIYMALIVLLILSEDDLFNKAVHQVSLQNITWYTERHVSEMSVGGMLVLVIIRTIQYNMTRMRDKYLHTNCLAALANMSSHFHNLHPYVAQRIVSLYELLCKKHSRIIETMRSSPSDSSNGDTASEDTADSTSDQVYDLSILEEVIRMVLEMINSSLTCRLRDNPNLVYTMLYRRELFEHFRSHPAFQDILSNIDTVLQYFSSKLHQEQEALGGDAMSPEQVLEVIKISSNQWPKDRIRKFPDLKFKYVEEDQPEEFFVPYVWSLVHQVSTLYWKDATSHLFTPSTL